MGWVMLFVGILLPMFGGWWLIGKLRTDLALSVVGLTSLPLLIWAGSLGAKIGPCKVDGCMSSTQHSHYVIALVALAVLVVAFVLLATGRRLVGGAAIAVSQLVGAYAMLKTDTVAVIMFLVLAATAAGYLVARNLSQREAARVPDFPPA